VAEISVEIGEMDSSLIPKTSAETTTSEPTEIGFASRVTRSRAIVRKTEIDVEVVQKTVRHEICVATVRLGKC
jgi:hypothetical protein